LKLFLLSARQPQPSPLLVGQLPALQLHCAGTQCHDMYHGMGLLPKHALRLLGYDS